MNVTTETPQDVVRHARFTRRVAVAGAVVTFLFGLLNIIASGITVVSALACAVCWMFTLVCLHLGDRMSRVIADVQAGGAS